MFQFKLRYCRARMVAFLNGELPPKSRQRVARAIDECPDCYREFVHQRELWAELNQRLPAFGQPRPEQLDRIWESVQREMQPVRYGRPRTHHLRYGLVALALAVTMLFPMTVLGDGVASAIIATQPMPEDRHTTAMTSAPAQATQVAIVTQPVDSTDEMNTIMPEAVPQRTPRPGQ